VTPVEAIERARHLDADDPLAHFRHEFVIDDPDLIYLDGNSLGRLPKRTAELLKQLIEQQWGGRLVRGWGEHWIDLPRRIGAKIATLIGANEDEVLVCDSTSVNFYKLTMAALEIQKGRTEIVTDSANFPSDVYLLQGCAKQTGHSIRIAEPNTVPAALGSSTALLTLSHTSFKAGFIHPMAELTAAAHDAGAMTLWDLSHSVGSVPVDLNGCHADLAVGCTYKFLNGGPGSPAFLYVRKDLQDKLMNPIWGWFGQKSAFEFSLDYIAAQGLQRFMAGTPSILSLAAVECGVDLILEAGIDRIRQKSMLQTEFLIELWEAFLEPLGFSLNSPRKASDRGSHVSFGHPDAYRIDQALIQEMRVVPDFRNPDNIRFGVTPLYTTFEELAEAVLRTRVIVEGKLYEKYSGLPSGVT
jgi:kynureninase